MLSASVALSGATGSFAVPAAPTVGSVQVAALPALRGMTLLEQLAELPTTDLAGFLGANTEVISQLVSAPPAAAEVTLWWSGLAIDTRSSFLSGAPQMVGNLEGVPFDLRDYANRQVLASTVESVAAPAKNVGRSALIDANGTGHLLGEIQKALIAPAGAPARHLVSLDPSGSGTAAIVIGDLEDADYVSYLVPGMFYTVDTQMVRWADAAQAVYDTEVEWADRDTTVATVAWIGYETPGMIDFTTLDLAYGGRDAIAASVDGLRAIRGADQPYLSVIAHSYGSTAAMMALADLGIEVDALAVIGSPGSDAPTAASLGVVGGNVYVGEADWDQVKDTSFFGVDPGSTAFGAHVFSVDGGEDPRTGLDLLGSTGHDEYFVRGSESLRNLALISLGRGFLVTTDDPGSIAPKGYAGLNRGGR